MAIKVGGVPVITDERAILNLSTPLSIDQGGTGANTAATARNNLGLSTGATATVTTSNTDATAGRLLKVGDFGIGNSVSLGAGQNLDALTNTGFYRLQQSNTVGGVVWSTADWSQIAVVRGGDTIAQTLYRYSDGQVFVRAGNPPDVGGVGSWTPWSEVARTSAALEWALTQTFNGIVSKKSIREVPVTGNAGTAYTINLNNGTVFDLTLNQSNCNFTFPTATAGLQFTLMVRLGAAGRTYTFPSSVRWDADGAPVISTVSGRTDRYVFQADGTYWLASAAGIGFVRS